VKHKIHPTSVISGFRLASKEACKFISETLAKPVDSLDKQVLINAAKTAISSKIIGSDSDHFARLAVEATLRIKAIDWKGDSKYPIKQINILKAHGKSAKESYLIEGYALNCTIAAQGMPTSIKNAKIACLDFALHRARMAQGVIVNITDPKNSDAVQQR
jgi:T-complex protein 1 subunit alpha